MGSDAGLLTITSWMQERQPDLIARTRAWRNAGRMGTHRYRHQIWGVRARMDEYSAAECLAELASLEQWNARRRAIAERYTAALSRSIWTAPVTAPERQHSFFSYMVKAPDLHNRMELLQRLREANIGIADAYTVVADQPPYKNGSLPSRTLPLGVSQSLEQLLVPLPCYPELTEDEIERIEAVLTTL